MDQITPSLACESCAASIPLSRVTRLGGHLRSIECQDCRSVMTWSLAAEADLDLREHAVSVEPEPDEVAARRARDR